MTDTAMTTIDVAALNVLADWFNKLPDGGMGKEHFDGLVIVVSELLSRVAVPSEQPVPPTSARPASGAPGVAPFSSPLSRAQSRPSSRGAHEHS